MKKLIQNLLIFSIVLILGEVSLSIAQTQRNPVLEYVTGTWCVYCPQGHEIIRNDILPNILRVLSAEFRVFKAAVNGITL